MPISDWSKFISASVVPVVIISACGLLCLAFYNRLAAIVSRLRTFQRERLHETEPDPDRHRKLMENLEFQTARVMRRARLIRLTLIFLLVTIALLIGCSILLGLSALVPPVIFPAIALFVLGLLTMLAGTITAIIELKAALEPAEVESRFVSAILREEPVDSI